MNPRRLIGTIIVVAVVVVGLMSHHLHSAVQAIHVTHGLWFIGKVAAVVLAAAGLLVARVYKALRPIPAASKIPRRDARDARS